MKPKDFLFETKNAFRDPMLALGVCLILLTPLLAVAASLDERSLFGRSPWEKPLRFSISLGVYAVTIAFASQWLLNRTRIIGWKWLAPILIGTGIFEIGWITVQASRGVDSHFNEMTSFEALMFSLMGVGATILSLGVLWLGLTALRLSFRELVPKDHLIAVGIALGFIGTGLLLPWTGEALVQPGISQSAIAANWVLPLFGWRLDGSDPRPAHFVAAHIMQILPLMAIWLARTYQPNRHAISIQALIAMTVGSIFLTLWLIP